MTVATPQEPQTDMPLLRAGTPGDAPAVAALIRRENRRPADEAAIAESLAAAPSVVAVDGDELVAFLYGRPFAPDVVEMQNMLIAGRLRRHGLGRRMVARLEDELRAAGFRAAIGSNSVLHRNTTPERCMAARAFWLRMGWHIVLATGGSVVLVRWLGPAPPPGSGQGVAAALGSGEGASPNAPAMSS